MSKLTDAMERAEERKQAVFGEPEAPTVRTPSVGSFEDRAVFSGFDVDTDELSSMMEDVSMFFMRLHHTAGLLGMGPDLRHLFSTAWVDGFLVGLLYSKGGER